MSSRIDPRLQQLVAEAMATVEHALQALRAAKGRERVDALKAFNEAVTNYVQLCDKWLSHSSRRR